MYPRQSRTIPAWLIVVSAMLLVFGGYYIWRGLIDFFDSRGDIAAPATYAVSTLQTATFDTFSAQGNVPTVNVASQSLSTPKPSRVCHDFRVIVIRARVRECPNETCNTVVMPGQGAQMCVYGPAQEAPEWYEVNVNPDAPVPHIGYMHNSVVEAISPTKRPTITPTPLPTITPVPSLTSTQTMTPPPSNTPDPAAPATWTLTPTPTPIPPIQNA